MFTDSATDGKHRQQVLNNHIKRKKTVIFKCIISYSYECRIIWVTQSAQITKHNVKEQIQCWHITCILPCNTYAQKPYVTVPCTAKAMKFKVETNLDASKLITDSQPVQEFLLFLKEFCYSTYVVYKQNLNCYRGNGSRAHISATCSQQIIWVTRKRNSMILDSKSTHNFGQKVKYTSLVPNNILSHPPLEIFLATKVKHSMSRRDNVFKVRIFSTWTSISISTTRILHFTFYNAVNAQKMVAIQFKTDIIPFNFQNAQM